MHVTSNGIQVECMLSVDAFPSFWETNRDIRVGKKELTVDNMKKTITKAGNSRIYANDKKKFGIGHYQI